MTICANKLMEDGTADVLAQVRAYHERTKHTLNAYAKGPETLDWSEQPDPFRTFDAERIPLVLAADSLTARYADLGNRQAVASKDLTLESVGVLLELSLAISAWKEYGPDRWALRCNPSSGNLHPTEGYVISRGVVDLDDGVYHYLSRDHVLERRFRPNSTGTDAHDRPRLWIGLSSIHWREAWKYGERAFRYCQLDLGHALGAFAYAAATLGWRVRLLETTGSAQIAALLGLDRRADFGVAEAEDPEVVFEVCIEPVAELKEALPDWNANEGTWYGQANVLDRHPFYRWPVIDEVAVATRKPVTASKTPAVEAYSVTPMPEARAEVLAASLIRSRRSAQAFDGRYVMPTESFFAMLEALIPNPSVPWDSWCQTPKIHPVLFVHRVEDLAPGVYALPRSGAGESVLRTTLRQEFSWTKPEQCPPKLPLYRLAEGDGRAAARTLSCHQRIASDSAFTLGMLAEFQSTLYAEPWCYRSLYWEAGLLGQVLYLEAEYHGIRGTGIGCYFDDTFHEVLGIETDALHSLYHFTVGLPIEDKRILTLPPYPNRGSA